MYFIFNTNYMLSLIANRAENLSRDMEADSRCNPKFTRAVEWIRDDLYSIINK